MLFDLPPDKTLYQALVARDAAFEGRAWVGVTSTGVFCRLTCPARKPKPENCVFFGSIAGCVDAGFRACLRCHPLAPMADGAPQVMQLLEALHQDPAAIWDEARIAALGHDPSTIRRQFKRLYGVTFLQMARMGRLRTAAQRQIDGGRVIDAQLEAGFRSGAGFRAAFAGWLGMAPAAFKKGGLLRADWIDTELGAMVAVSDRQHLHLLEFTERKSLPRALKQLHDLAGGDLGLGRYPPTDQVEQELAQFFAGTRAAFNVVTAFHGTAFTQQVWRALQTIPAGQTRSYSAVARMIGRPDAVRAVARANGANPLAIVVPCHRVLGADGALTGYGGGLWRKERLIQIEHRYRKDEP